MSAQSHIPWSDDERQQLRRLFDNGLTQRQIGVLLGRTKSAVSRQCQHLALQRPSVVAAQPAAQPTAPHRAGTTTLPPLPSLTGLAASAFTATSHPDADDNE